MRQLWKRIGCLALVLTLMLAVVPGEPEKVKADTGMPSSAPIYTLGQELGYSIERGSEAWYQFTLQETSVVRLGLRKKAGSATWVHIYGGDGQNYLGCATGSGQAAGGQAALLPGTYYVFLYGGAYDYNRNETEGTFIVEVVDDGQTFQESEDNLMSRNDSPASASKLTSDGICHGIVGGNNAADYYKVEVGDRGMVAQILITAYRDKVCPFKIMDSTQTNTLFTLDQADKLTDFILYKGTYYIYADCGKTPTVYAQSYDIILREADLQHYNIKYVMNGGRNSEENPDSYIEGGSLTLAEPSREGYTFGGWFENAALTKETTGISEDDRGDKTFYAKWNPITYRITYDTAGGINNSKNKTSYTIETKTFKLKNAKRKGYKFKGWFDEEGERVKSIQKGTTGDISLTAVWKKK